jgi:hypothetical protein
MIFEDRVLAAAARAVTARVVAVCTGRRRSTRGRGWQARRPGGSSSGSCVSTSVGRVAGRHRVAAGRGGVRVLGWWSPRPGSGGRQSGRSAGSWCSACSATAHAADDRPNRARAENWGPGFVGDLEDLVGREPLLDATGPLTLRAARRQRRRQVRPPSVSMLLTPSGRPRPDLGRSLARCRP